MLVHKLELVEKEIDNIHGQMEQKQKCKKLSSGKTGNRNEYCL